MDAEVAAFERRLAGWMRADDDLNGACRCCMRRRSLTGREVLAAWTLLPREDRARFLDEHGEDRYVDALHDALELARDAALEPALQQLGVQL